MNLDLNLTSYEKINSNSIINLDVKHKTIMVLENNGENLEDLGLGENFLRHQSMTHKRKKINKFDPNKIKNFCSARDLFNRIKREAIHWGENIYKPHI